MRDTHRNEADEVDKKFIGTTRFLSKLHFKITDKAKFLYGELHLRMHLMKSDFECIGIYIPCQSHRRNFSLMFYRVLVYALISSHHQALSRNKGTESSSAISMEAALYTSILQIHFLYLGSWAKPDHGSKLQPKLVARKTLKSSFLCVTDIECIQTRDLIHRRGCIV